ncbi:YbhB/YbcL family Raf kinase inhibitor-like protein [Motiliproteus sp. MSK22-1]|uniref:YbhB/YbcL family Raf kinase inhibitor-like protein n=1 Tax=Motiliproteus sp. MSK22-1 TaxID=1897630 RepID=UPI000976179F|nr:YbhB/YbcL family Raf kinase inhibitor-like protein [Motiliproteus sp. MSK22-1]OMH38891.1 kinase inhibitor [Motiliproteus sp. MSK22-1]
MSFPRYGQLFLSTAFALAISAPLQAFELNSSDISEGSTMPKAMEFAGFGCSGNNQSPALKWTNPPAGTKSFAITAYDPDAPTGSGWWHWLVTDIPANVTQLKRGAGSKEGKLPVASRSFSNDYGTMEFGGACPPEGDGMHRYQFTIWALGVDKLSVPDNASSALVGYMLNANAIEKTRLTATYHR